MLLYTVKTLPSPSQIHPMIQQNSSRTVQQREKSSGLINQVGEKPCERISKGILTLYTPRFLLSSKTVKISTIYLGKNSSDIFIFFVVLFSLQVLSNTIYMKFHLTGWYSLLHKINDIWRLDFPFAHLTVNRIDWLTTLFSFFIELLVSTSVKFGTESVLPQSRSEEGFENNPPLRTNEQIGYEGIVETNYDNPNR